MLVLGICGRAHSGKTTACRAIENECKRLDLSVAVGDIGASVLDYCKEHWLLPNKARADLTKDELQVLVDTGKRLREQQGENFWLNRIECIAKGTHDVFVIPNIRYPNELIWIKEHNGYTIKLVSLNEDGTVYIAPDRDPNHVSETATQNANTDFIIIAKGWQDRLVEAQAAVVFKFIREKESSKVQL